MTISLNNFSPRFQQRVVYKIKDATLVRNIEIIDLNTMKRYKNESMQSIAKKAFFIFLFNPLVLFLRIAFNVFQMPFDFVKMTIDSSIDTAIAFRHGKIIKIFEIYITSKIDLVRYLAEDIISIVSAPFYSLGIQIASIFTIFFPLEGRKIVADIERSWNRNKSAKQHDFRYSKETQNKPWYKVIFEMLLTRNENIVLYMAPCFQSLGSLDDKRVIYYSDI